MAENQDIIVLKFGGSVLRADADIPNIVHEVYRWYRQGFAVVAVVSAVGNTTDDLLSRAREFSRVPEDFGTAELLATGETVSAALLGIALDRAGIASRVLNPREIRLTVSGTALDSGLVSVDARRLQELLEKFPVLVIPGFYGTDTAGRTHCLGRGGSDLSAVFLACALRAKVRLVKDVDGVFDADPNDAAALPRRFSSLDYADALRVAGPLIQPKAVTYLREHDAEAEVAAVQRGYASLVHAGATAFATPVATRPPLKVVLLGLGTVGYGVYQRLQANPDNFDVIGAVVRNPKKHRAVEIPEITQFSDAQGLDSHGDVVVDALPGLEPSRILVERALRAGVSVVSANKALIAEYGPSLRALTSGSGPTLHYSAAVGGSTPMIELLDRYAIRGISEIAAVLNGTCNYVLDACGEGALLESSIAEAQHAGFAEANPMADLLGDDAARKLQILCRHAWHQEVNGIERQALDGDAAVRAAEVRRDGRRLRQIAHASFDGNRVYARVSFEIVEADSFFGRTEREWNAVEVTDVTGHTHRMTGRGAGCWPTTEALVADLFDLYRRF